MNFICTNYPACNHGKCYHAAFEQIFNRLSDAREMKHRKMLDDINEAATKAVRMAVEAQDKVLVDRDDLVTILDWFHTENMHTKEDYKSMGAVLDRLEAALKGGG